MSNSEISKVEYGNERIPTREDILIQIGKRLMQIEKHCEGVEVIRELSDKEEIYLFEAREKGEKSGKFTGYLYRRGGIFPGKNEAVSTIIEEVYFVGGVACGGKIVAEYNRVVGEWVGVEGEWVE